MSNWLRGRTVVYNPVPKALVKVRRFHPGKILWEALKRAAMAMGFVLIFSIVVGAWTASQMTKKQVPNLPKQMVLVLDLTGQEESAAGPARYLEGLGLGSGDISISDTIDAIDAAAKDKRVKALALFLGTQQLELADLQEVRGAIMRFKESKKPVRAYADSYGGGGSGLGMYYLASAADQIWMQPVGVVAIPGMTAQLPFGRGLLDKIGVRPEFFQRKEYKTAMEHFTSTGMSEASREQMVGLINDLGDQIAGQIAKDRKSVAGNFKQLIDRGLFTDEEALQVKLLDRVDYQDVFVAELRKDLEGDAKAKKPDFISVEEFAAVTEYERGKEGMLAKKGNPLVARITIDGMITDGSGGVSPLTGNEPIVTASTIAGAIMQAAEDKNVKAILIRIDSPGGTPSASETIHRAIIRARTDFKKPVIISMGNTAASGGYWVAAAGDKIYASNSTLTGSIGVVGGKFDASGLWDKLDVNWEEVSYGKNGGMWSFNKPFSPDEQERFEASLDNVYAAFIKRVTEGRKLSPTQVEAIAKGHVWSGRKAKELGLVDVIGGEDKALDELAQTLGKDNRLGLRVMDLPRSPSPLEEILQLLSQQIALPAFLPKVLLGEMSPLLMQQDGRLVYEALPEIRP